MYVTFFKNLATQLFRSQIFVTFTPLSDVSGPYFYILYFQFLTNVLIVADLRFRVLVLEIILYITGIIFFCVVMSPRHNYLYPID